LTLKKADLNAENAKERKKRNLATDFHRYTLRLKTKARRRDL